MFNQLKTVALLGLLTGLMLGVGGMIGGRGGLTVALVFAGLMNFGMYFFSDRIALAMYGAQEAKKSQYHKLHKMVEELAHKAGIPKPKVYVIPIDTPNAFATGRSPSHASVAATEGIMSLLSDDELRGVLAHEISHVKNRDTLVVTIAATMAGVISYLAHMAQFAAFFGGGRDDGGRNPIGLLVLAIITPIMAMLIQMAISRSREYLADESGAHLIKDGKPLASALKKLEMGVRHHPMRVGSPATSSLFIVNPFSGNAIMSLLSTHPPLHKRVERLHQLKF
ncbi:zinc metalloprotease HtpX [Candidatus Woesearchaeota archaeon]|nr:zinc metalloprotease HtpX [Candidatus Woesearchaeota archaeon]